MHVDLPPLRRLNGVITGSCEECGRTTPQLAPSLRAGRYAWRCPTCTKGNRGDMP